MATNTFSLPQYVQMSRGSSRIADFAVEEYARRYGEGIQKLQESYMIGQKESLSELDRVCEECKSAGWDGYGSEAVSASARKFSKDFLLALPLGTPAPAVGAEPDGHITLEWYKSPYQTLSVSVSPEGHLHFAALMGASKQYGSEPFCDEMPQPILNLIYRVSMR